MPDPMFTIEERSSQSADGLPAELQGKSPADIAKYYQNRERQIIDKAKDAIRASGTPLPPPTRVTMERATETTVPAGELDGARATLRETAKQAAKNRNNKYWSRFESDIETVMAKMGTEQQCDFNYWEAVYHNLVGQNKDKLENEEREAATTAARLVSERPAGGLETPIPDQPLPAVVTGKICPGLEISEKQYRTASEKMSSGVWPLTFDSKQGRVA